MWEALYREILHTYICQGNPRELISNVKCLLESGIQESQSPQQLMERITTMIQELDSFDEFMTFAHKMAGLDDIWKLWIDFVFVNCHSYIGLYLAIRGSDWKLRVCSLKQMAPLFAAFDRDTYERIIPNHLADIKQYPPVILKCLEKGGFTVAITNKQWHSVAFVEAYEMCINKDLKAAIIRPSKAYLQKTSLFFNY